MMFINDRQHMLWTQKVCRKYIFLQIYLANSKKTESLGENGCRQKYLDKSLLKKGGFYQQTFYVITKYTAKIAKTETTLTLESYDFIH